MAILLSIHHIDVLNGMRNDYDTLLELAGEAPNTPGLVVDTKRTLARLRFPSDVPLIQVTRQARDERRILHYLLNIHMSRLAFADGNKRPFRRDIINLFDRHLDGIDVAKRAGKWHRADGGLDIPDALQDWRDLFETSDVYETLPMRIQR